MDSQRPLSFNISGLKPVSHLDNRKLSAFQLAPTRKTALEKSREEAQRKADKDAAETAAALAEFEAAYGVDDEHEPERHESSRESSGRDSSGGGSRGGKRQETWRDETSRRNYDTSSNRNRISNHDRNSNYERNSSYDKSSNHDRNSNYDRNGHYDRSSNHDRSSEKPSRTDRQGSAMKRAFSGFGESDSDEADKEKERTRSKLPAIAGSSYQDHSRHDELRSSSGPIQNKQSEERPRDKWQSTTRPKTQMEDSSKDRYSSTDASQRQEKQQQQQQQQQVNEDEDESGDDVDYYRTRETSMISNEPLNKIHRARLEFLLDTLTARRGSVARLSAFAIIHAASVNDISDAICDRLAQDKDDWKIAVARLWVVSDILHNSWIPISNVWKYRAAFETRLPTVMANLKVLGESISSRIRRENFRRLVTAVLNVWSTWICFSAGVMQSLYAAFDEKEEKEEVVVHEVKQKKKSGGWKKVDGSQSQTSSFMPITSEAIAEVDLDGEATDLDGQHVSLDGEAIDLDGDLDGDDIDLDADMPGSTGMLQDVSDRGRDNTESEANPDPSTSLSSIQGMPKIKMTFGKVQIGTSLPAEHNGMLSAQIEEKPMVSAQTEQADDPEAIKKVNSDGPLTGTHPATNIKDRKVRPQRRSAADFMD